MLFFSKGVHPSNIQQRRQPKIIHQILMTLHRAIIVLRAQSFVKSKGYKGNKRTHSQCNGVWSKYEIYAMSIPMDEMTYFVINELYAFIG